MIVREKPLLHIKSITSIHGITLIAPVMQFGDVHPIPYVWVICIH